MFSMAVSRPSVAQLVEAINQFSSAAQPVNHAVGSVYGSCLMAEDGRGGCGQDERSITGSSTAYTPATAGYPTQMVVQGGGCLLGPGGAGGSGVVILRY
jgi:hypothetical protein